MEKFEASEKLSQLAQFCKNKYEEADLLQHNWEHIARNIYRAEKIAEKEENVDMETLYAATMLHDIGVTVGEYEDHEENSRKLAEEKLPEFGFSEEETEKILEVLREFAEDECDLVEAKILSDADKLEKSSLASVFNTFKIAHEFDREVHEMLDDLSRYRKLAEGGGFYTEKAREIDNGGLKERYEFLKKLREMFEDREDFKASEKDLGLDL
jgi:HD superfamily phosphodiesterase